MKSRDALTDDDGTRWEFLYDTLSYREEVAGEVLELTRVIDFRYRQLESERDVQGEWMGLPPWADVAPQWKITLCFFDEDDDGELTFWEVLS